MAPELPLQPLYALCDVRGTFLHFGFKEATKRRPRSAPPHSCFLDIAPRVQEAPPPPARKNKKLSKQTREQEEEIEWRQCTLLETWQKLAQKAVTKDKDDCYAQGM